MDVNISSTLILINDYEDEENDQQEIVEKLENLMENITLINQNTNSYIKKIKIGMEYYKEMTMKIIFKAFFTLYDSDNKKKEIKKLLKIMACSENSTDQFIKLYKEFRKELHVSKLLKMYIQILIEESKDKKRSNENLKKLMYPCIPLRWNKQIDERYKELAKDMLRFMEIIKVKESDGEAKEFIKTKFELGKGGTSKINLGFQFIENNSNNNIEGEINMVAVKKFNNEVRERAILESQFLIDNPSKSITNLISHGLVHGNYVQIIEYIGGFDLEKFLQKNKFLTETKAKEIFEKVASTLCDLDISHRDLKPSNIMLRYDHSIVLIDFTMFSTQSFSNSMVGTLKYMAPEVSSLRSYNKENEEYDSQKYDVWSLGVILYEMLFGISNIDFRTNETFLNDLNEKNISNSLKTLLKHMLKKNQLERFSLAEVLNSDWLTSQEELEKLEYNIESMKIGVEKLSDFLQKHFKENKQIDFEFLERCLNELNRDYLSPDVLCSDMEVFIDQMEDDISLLYKNSSLSLPLDSDLSFSCDDEEDIDLLEHYLSLKHQIQLFNHTLLSNLKLEEEIIIIQLSNLFFSSINNINQYLQSIRVFRKDCSSDSLERFDYLEKKLKMMSEIFSHLQCISFVLIE